MMVLDKRVVLKSHNFFALSRSLMAIVITDHWKVRKEWTSKCEYSASVSPSTLTDVSLIFS